MAFAPRSRVTLRPDAIAFDTTALPPRERTYSRDFSTDVLLGEGGMGRVISARDTRLGRRVAIKELRWEMRQEAEFWGRFVREAQIGAQLEHPNIVPIYGFELSPTGSPAFVMQLIDGESLGAYLARANQAALDPAGDVPPLKTRIAKLLPVLDAMGYAHGRGVLHRDLKPDNVMLGAHNVVLVTDWGIARVDGDDEWPESRLTNPAGAMVADGGQAAARAFAAGQERISTAPTLIAPSGHGETAYTTSVSSPVQTALGSVLGTAQYMSPEQAIGAPIGPASDQYALGLMLLELSTMRAARPHENTEAAYGQAVRGEQCPHVTVRGEALDPRLSAIITRATSKYPAGRYPDVDAFAQDLRAFLVNEEVSVAPDSLARRIIRGVQKRPGRTVGAVLAIVLGLAAFAISGLSSAASRAEAGRRDSESLSRLAAKVQADGKGIERYLLGMDAELRALAEIARMRLEQPLPVSAAPLRLVEPKDILEGTLEGLVRNPVDGLLRSYREPVFVFLPDAGSGARDAAQQLALGKADLIDLYVGVIDERAGELSTTEREALMASDHDGFVRLLVALEVGLFMQFPARGEFPASYDPRRAEWYERAASEKGTTVTRPKYGPAGKTGRIALVRPIRSKGRLLGAANAGVWLRTVVRQLDPPDTAGLTDSFLAAADGKEVVSRRVLERAETPGEPEGYVELVQVVSAPLRRALARGQQQGYVVDGHDLYVYSRLAVEDWFAVHRYRTKDKLQLAH